MVKLIYIGLNLIWMLHLRLIIFSVECDVLIDSETFLMTDFMNLNIKSTQSFKNVHKNRVYIYIFIRISDHTYINIYIYTIFLKKYWSTQEPRRRKVKNIIPQHATPHDLSCSSAQAQTRLTFRFFPQSFFFLFQLLINFVFSHLGMVVQNRFWVTHGFCI
jgi:hypothetical protein